MEDALTKDLPASSPQGKGRAVNLASATLGLMPLLIRRFAHRI
jgi:hypothetical protein